MILLILAIVTALILFYVLHGRAWLKTKPWAAGFFRLVEPVEIALFQKSETMLVGRALWVGGLLVTFYDTFAVFATSLDWTPITSRLLADVPADMRGLVVSAAIGGLGLLIGWLRKRTSKPLEVVALPVDAPIEVVVAASQAETANQQAVETIAAAKAEGVV